MNPHFFGTPSHPLFGIHVPSSDGRGVVGAVLCPPMGQEALRAHRALRILSDQLADAGVDVLRFDYFGTGDSGGGTREGMPSVWLADIRLAVQHLREMSGVRRVVLVGARLGGLLAACAEARSVSRLVLWDPVTSGRELVAELQQYAEGDAREWEVQGFPVTAPVRRELEALDLGSVKRVPPEVRLVVSQASTGLAHLQADLEARRARVETAHIDAPAAWLEDGDFGAGAVPVPVLRQIVTWVQ